MSQQNPEAFFSSLEYERGVACIITWSLELVLVAALRIIAEMELLSAQLVKTPPTDVNGFGPPAGDPGLSTPADADIAAKKTGGPRKALKKEKSI